MEQQNKTHTREEVLEIIKELREDGMVPRIWQNILDDIASCIRYEIARDVCLWHEVEEGTFDQFDIEESDVRFVTVTDSAVLFHLFNNCNIDFYPDIPDTFCELVDDINFFILGEIRGVDIWGAEKDYVVLMPYIFSNSTSDYREEDIIDFSKEDLKKTYLKYAIDPSSLDKVLEQ